MDAHPVTARPAGDIRLMRWFAFSGFAAIGIFSLALALALGGFLASRWLTRDAEVSRKFVQSVAARGVGVQDP